MKVYHGTSFESACNILQSDYWEDRFGDFAEECIKLSTKQSQKTVKELYERFEILKGIHFTTSLSHAMSYDSKKKHPVILEMDYPTGNCLDFKVSDPIKTNKIHATIIAEESINRKMELNQVSRINMYGKLINEFVKELK